MLSWMPPPFDIPLKSTLVFGGRVMTSIFMILTVLIAAVAWCDMT